MLTLIDKMSRGVHFYLEPTDRVAYLHEYTSGKNYDFSEENRWISNFKKGLEKRDKPEWKS